MVGKGGKYKREFHRSLAALWILESFQLAREEVIDEPARSASPTR